MKALLLLVTYTAKPGMRETFLQDVKDSGLLSVIRKETGCLQYEYYLDADREERILLVEKWASLDLQQLHQAQPHMKQLMEIKNRSIAETRVERMTVEGDD